MKTNERWLVCGGRNLEPQQTQAALDALSELAGARGMPSVVIEGGASGYDHAGRLWAVSREMQCITFYADWNTHGRAAGPIRNSRMLAEGKPTHVIAFPGGVGTRDMVAKAKRAGIPVIDGLTGEVLDGTE